MTTLTSCRRASESDRRCRAFTFNTRHNTCFPKEDGTVMVTNADAISGYPPDLSQEAVQVVLEQAEALLREIA
ncbi:MAG: PAN domain-containing protein [Roseinatronobacter sp.]